MSKKSLVLVLAQFLLSSLAFGYGQGISTHPILKKQRLATAEATGILSGEGGVGLQLRYTQKLLNNLIVDGGFGFANGDRSNRLFVSADYELFPDYQKQPRISIKGTFENADEDGDGESRSNIVKIAPTVSKGFVFWGKEAYPYIALPVALSLESEDQKYKFTQRLAIGATGNIPVQGYQKLIASFETSINLNNGYSGVFFGVSYPIN